MQHYGTSKQNTESLNCSIRFSCGLCIHRVLCSHLDFVTVLQLGDDDPCRNNAEEGDTKVDANADKVVGIAFRLHSGQVSLCAHVKRVLELTPMQRSVRGPRTHGGYRSGGKERTDLWCTGQQASRGTAGKPGQRRSRRRPMRKTCQSRP